jgi:2-dehydropantoate 2-reductase
MRIAIIGAGATGAFLGARLARAGEAVTLIARGAHLEAMRAGGVRIVSPEGEFVAHPQCTPDLTAAGKADIVFLTVKAYALAGIVPPLSATLGPETAVVTAQNGIPWWYFQREGGPLDGSRVESVDPGGVLFRSLTPDRLIGCVVWPATRLIAPGVIEHVEGTRFTIGELDSARSDRCLAISRALTGAGLKCPVSRRIRHDIWLKLLGSVAVNPISALTRATLEQIGALPEAHALARAVTEEADAVAAALGVRPEIGIDRRLEGAFGVGAYRTSMLQDLEAGRPLELEALAGAVLELGDRFGIALPHLRTVYACVKLLCETRRSQSLPEG